MELSIPAKISRALQHEARRRHTTAESIALSAIEDRIYSLQNQPIATEPQVRFNMEQLSWRSVQSATQALIRFCEENGCDDIESLAAIRNCAIAAERKDKVELKRFLGTLNLYHKGFPDWLPASAREPSRSPYLGEIFQALLSRWYEHVSQLLRSNATFLEDSDDPSPS